MTDQVNSPPDEPFSRAMVLGVIYAAASTGLPAPSNIRFRESALFIGFDSIADRIAWEQTFDLNDGRHVGRSEQPYPLDSDYREWTTHVWASWHGWTLSLEADDPITDENMRWWVESGRAAQRAQYVAQQTAEGGEQA
jgi:hypothetical protein